MGPGTCALLELVGTPLVLTSGEHQGERACRPCVNVTRESRAAWPHWLVREGVWRRGIGKRKCRWRSLTVTEAGLVGEDHRLCPPKGVSASPEPA